MSILRTLAILTGFCRHKNTKFVGSKYTTQDSTALYQDRKCLDCGEIVSPRIVGDANGGGFD